jgi:hypothetical protein
MEGCGSRLGSLVVVLILLAYGGRLEGGDPPRTLCTAIDRRSAPSHLRRPLLILLWIGSRPAGREFLRSPPGLVAEALGSPFSSYVVDLHAAPA